MIQVASNVALVVVNSAAVVVNTAAVVVNTAAVVVNTAAVVVNTAVVEVNTAAVVAAGVLDEVFKAGYSFGHVVLETDRPVGSVVRSDFAWISQHLPS